MKIISHRGLHNKYPENTLKAFEQAGKQPRYDGIECDIYTTSDGVFVVHHDPTLNRLSGINQNIMDLSYDELSTKGYIIHGKRKERIPSLVEFLDVCSIYQKTPFVEIKQVHDITQLTELVEIINKYHFLEPIIISFNMNYLKYIRTISDISLQLLLTKIDDDIIYDCQVNGIDLAINKESITRKLVKDLKQQHFKVAVFTVNHNEMFERYEKMGIEYLTTDL